MPLTNLKSGRAPDHRAATATPGNIGLTAAIVCLFAGYSYYKSSHTRVSPRLIQVMDLHQSAQDKKRECAQFLAILDRMPSGTEVLVESYDTNAVVRYRGTPADARELGPVEDFLAQAPPEGAYTKPAIALGHIRSDVDRARANSQDVYVVVNTDGDDFSPDQTHAEAAILARNPAVQAIWITNVAPVSNLRNIVERSYRPFGSRLIVSGPQDQMSGFTNFQSALNRGRRAHSTGEARHEPSSLSERTFGRSSAS